MYWWWLYDPLIGSRFSHTCEKKTEMQVINLNELLIGMSLINKFY
jgi:hypothetical protein